jgi:hypothetical protein
VTPPVNPPATVTYDVSSKITFTHQDPGQCAFACIAMCVNETIEKIKADGTNDNGTIKDGFNPAWPTFLTIASYYGYSLISNDVTSLSTVLEHLENGYPVAVEIKNHEGPHWVVITKYTGSTTNPQAENFTCADPDIRKGNNIPFPSAARYGNGTIHRSRAFKK